MMDVEKLKQKILDLAIRGKLVPQDPNDEPASVLIEKIRAEKEELIKQGKIKRDKNESYIFKGDDNSYYEKVGKNIKKVVVPFDIPNTWQWIRLNELGIFRKGPFGSSLTKDLFVSDSTPNRHKVYEQKNAIQKNWTLGSYYISDEKYKTMTSFVVEPNDIIVSCAGTIGEIYILPDDAEIGIINQALMRVRLYYKPLTDYFLMYFDAVLKREAADKGKGTGMKNIPPFDILKNMLFPLPTYSETIRILNKISEIARYIELIGTAKKEIFALSEQLKFKILDSFFGENSRYKSYYEKRVETTLENLVPKDKIGDGDWVLSKDMNPQGDIQLLQLKHIGDMIFQNKSFCHIDEQFFKEHGCSEIRENYLLINRLVATSMVCCLMPKTNVRTITSVDVCWIAPDKTYNSKYLMYYLSSRCFQQKVLLLCSGSTRKRISKKNLMHIPLFIHNRVQQDIIVTEIEKLFDLVKKVID